MRKPRPSFSWDEIDRLVGAPAEIPPNSFTAAEFSERYKMALRSAHNKLMDMFRQGKISRVQVGKTMHYYAEAKKAA